MGIYIIQGTEADSVTNLEGWGGEEDGKEVREGEDMGVPMANSC